MAMQRKQAQKNLTQMMVRWQMLQRMAHPLRVSRRSRMTWHTYLLLTSRSQTLKVVHLNRPRQKVPKMMRENSMRHPQQATS
jgi:hypothetical protein